MRRFDMAAAVSKLKIVAWLALVSACQAKPGVIELSEKFNVCAALPQDVSFQRREPGPDFDLGVLRGSGLVAEVQIGGHPRFSHRVIRTGVKATDGFKLLGTERSDGKDKYLFAYERGDEEGPMFVMFMAPDLRSAEQILTTKNLLVNCK